MLFNEPKLLKLYAAYLGGAVGGSFSALQRAEIAEIMVEWRIDWITISFSALQRAEIAEILPLISHLDFPLLFQCSSTSRNC